MKKISVIIPTYNSAAYLAATVRSALAQRDLASGTDVEIIVVDDGSTDDIGAAVQTLPPEVVYIRQKNGGVSSARNTGFQRATGELVCFLDADDILAPGWFTNALRFFSASPEVGVVFGGFHRWYGTAADDPMEVFETLGSLGKKLGQLEVAQEKSGWIYHRMLLDSWILCSSAIVRAETARKAGLFEESVPVGEDWDFWIRVSRLSPVIAVKDICVLYRQHASSASRKLREKNHAAELIIHAIKHYGWQSPSGAAASPADVYPVIAKHCLWHAVAHFDRGKYSSGLSSCARALRYQPLSPKCWRLLLIGLSGLARPYARRLQRHAAKNPT